MSRTEQLRVDLDLLAEAMRGHLDAGGAPPPCAHRHEWLSDDPHDRAEAAGACQHCTVFLHAACAAAGRHQRFGVLGGLDWTVKSHGARS